jgi:putative hydrolase of the HAD superfamily
MRKLAKVKAVIFDYIGTLVNCKSYSMDASRAKLYNALAAEGFTVGKDRFLAAYIRAHEKYRLVRYEQLREVTNAVWVAEALSEVGYKVHADDVHVKAALNVFFKDYVDSLTLRDGAKKLVEKAAQWGKIGLVSNFTHAPVVYSSMRQLGIGKFFNAVVVSDANGWRKPSEHIFNYALSMLQVKASEAVYVGDSPLEDIKGAKDVGLRTVFVPSQFNSLSDLLVSKLKPDFTAIDLEEIFEKFCEIFG